MDIAQRLAEITDTAWAVVPAADLAASLRVLEAEPAPRCWFNPSTHTWFATELSGQA